LYLRCLESLERGGETTTSSRELSAALGITAAQVRKDLGYFGQFGYPGLGYKIPQLIGELRAILGTDRNWNVALVGIGHLGSALARYRGFERQGFSITALFDESPALVGTDVGGRSVRPLDALHETVEREEIQLGIVAVPADSAQHVADLLVEAGIRGIFNFAPAVLNLPDHVGYVSIDLAVQLEQLTFFVRQQAARQTDAASVEDDPDDRPLEGR